jgi:hypothetical protein
MQWLSGAASIFLCFKLTPDSTSIRLRNNPSKTVDCFNRDNEHLAVPELLIALNMEALCSSTATSANAAIVPIPPRNEQASVSSRLLMSLIERGSVRGLEHLNDHTGGKAS